MVPLITKLWQTPSMLILGLKVGDSVFPFHNQRGRSSPAIRTYGSTYSRGKRIPPVRHQNNQIVGRFLFLHPDSGSVVPFSTFLSGQPRDVREPIRRMHSDTPRWVAALVNGLAMTGYFALGHGIRAGPNRSIRQIVRLVSWKPEVAQVVKRGRSGFLPSMPRPSHLVKWLAPGSQRPDAAWILGGSCRSLKGRWAHVDDPDFG